MGTAIEELAHFVAGTPWEAIPEAIREHAKLVLLDTVGVILAGSVQPEVAGVRVRLISTGGRGATVYAPGWLTTDPRTAALLNGLAGRSIELCAAPAVSSASTAVIVARRCGMCRASSGGSDNRAGSRSKSSAATRASTSGARKMCSWSLASLTRTWTGLPAGISEIDPAEGGTCRSTPSYRKSSSFGGAVNSTSMWWVRAG
jgi:hypothetical protein